MNSTPDFRSLVSPLTPERFFDEHWGKKFLYIRGESRNAYREILTLNDMESFFQSGTLHPSFIRVIKSGIDCPLEAWTDLEKRRNTGFYHVVNNGKLFSQVAGGATVIINAAERSIPKVGLLCQNLRKELKLGIQANIYITPPNEEGFKIHFDEHDVFVLQVSGSKEWRVYKSLEGYDNNDDSLVSAGPDRQLSSEYRLSAGDLLYLPSKVFHEARTASEPSIHLTLGIQANKWFHLVEQMAQSARESPAFQHLIPHIYSGKEERRRFSEEFVSSLHQLFEETNVNDLAGCDSRRPGEISTPNSGKRFTDLFQSYQLNLKSIVGANPGIEFEIEESDKGITIKANSAMVTFAPVFGQTIKSIFARNSFAVDELMGLVSNSGKIELVAKLVRAGFMTIHAAN